MRAVGILCLFYTYYYRLCLDELGFIISALATPFRQTIHILSVSISISREITYSSIFFRFLVRGCFPSSPNLQFLKSCNKKLSLSALYLHMVRSNMPFWRYFTIIYIVMLSFFLNFRYMTNKLSETT